MILKLVKTTKKLQKKTEKRNKKHDKNLGLPPLIHRISWNVIMCVRVQILICDILLATRVSAVSTNDTRGRQPTMRNET